MIRVAYSADMKRLAMIMVYVDKHTYEHICNSLKICLTTLIRWIKLNKNDALYLGKPRVSVARKINDDDLRAYIVKNPDAYLYEIAEHLGVSKSGIHKACGRLKISYKKTPCYKERNEIERREFTEKIIDTPKENLIFLDESGISGKMHRTHGRGDCELMAEVEEEIESML